MGKRSKETMTLIPQILKLYTDGKSCKQIHELLNLSITPRSVERIIKNAGLTRTSSERFRLAIKNSRMKYKKLGPGMGAKEFRKGITLTLRYAAFKRDGFSCTLCGHDVEDGVKLEVDHILRPINGGKNTLENLRTLCSACNIGRWHAEKIFKV